MNPMSFPRKRESNKKAQVNTAGQAAVELAVFGAILVFLLGTIVRTAAGNSYTQNIDLKTMRMAMLASWNGSKAQNIARNSASVLFIEDRLSPDMNKYGDLDRNQYIASGGGTFSYMLMYPLTAGSGGDNIPANLPIMDVYINGQHFPFTTASYTSANLQVPSCGSGSSQPLSPDQIQCLQNPTASQLGCMMGAQVQCKLNQCLRNAREWVGGDVTESEFEVINLGSLDSSTVQNYATQIFCELGASGAIVAPQCGAGPNWPPFNASSSGKVANGGRLPSTFTTWFAGWYSSLNLPGTGQAQLNQIQSVLQSNQTQYKLFYTNAVNGTDQFNPSPPTCSNANSLPCKDKALSSSLQMPDANGNMHSNSGGDFLYDLQRLGIYDSTNPSFVTAASGMRPFISWQWSATAGTSAGMIGLDKSNNQYPSYDIDGRLKQVTIYDMSVNQTSCHPGGQCTDPGSQNCSTASCTLQNGSMVCSSGECSNTNCGPEGCCAGTCDLGTGGATVTYEDFQGGDIDSTWDANSCTPKPGLQSSSQIFTFTQNNVTSNGTPQVGPYQNGTYLQVKEGKLFNPETGQVVRSASKRDTVDLVQRTIQLSNNTGRFCSGATPLSTVANDQVTPNPVEVCIPVCAGTGCANCFSSEQNFKSTCFDENDNMLFVRSRLEDRRGNYWMTNASGQLQVQ